MISRVLRRGVVAALVLVVALPIASAGADPVLDSLNVPVCGDQADGDPATRCTGEWSSVTDVQTFQVPGSGSVKVGFDQVFRGGIFNNALVVVRVDDTIGSIDAAFPEIPPI